MRFVQRIGSNQVHRVLSVKRQPRRVAVAHYDTWCGQRFPGGDVDRVDGPAAGCSACTRGTVGRGAVAA